MKEIPPSQDRFHSKPSQLNYGHANNANSWICPRCTFVEDTHPYKCTVCGYRLE